MTAIIAGRELRLRSVCSPEWVAQAFLPAWRAFCDAKNVLGRTSACVSLVAASGRKRGVA